MTPNSLPLALIVALQAERNHRRADRRSHGQRAAQVARGRNSKSRTTAKWSPAEAAALRAALSTLGRTDRRIATDTTLALDAQSRRDSRFILRCSPTGNIIQCVSCSRDTRIIGWSRAPTNRLVRFLPM